MWNMKLKDSAAGQPEGKSRGTLDALWTVPAGFSFLSREPGVIRRLMRMGLVRIKSAQVRCSGCTRG